jgi:methionyl-tRNA formyltransferase
MRIDAGLDTGGILLQHEVPIEPEDTTETLGPKLAAVGAELMAETLQGLQSGQLRPVPQDHAGATLAPILRKEDGHIDFARMANEIFNRLRGFQPWPGAYTTFKSKTLQLHKARISEQSVRLDPGAIAVEGARLVAGCGHGTALELVEIQMEGKRRMLAREFINGYRPKTGDHLGQ